MARLYVVREELGLDFQLPMPEVPGPDEVPTFEERFEPFKEQLGDWYTRPRPIDTRNVDWAPMDRREPLPPSCSTLSGCE